MLIQEVITEVFSRSYPMKWEHGEDTHDALITLPDGTYLTVNFGLDYDGYGDEEWDVEFWRNNSQEVTGEGDAYQIFATVLEAIKQFIAMEDPLAIKFKARKDVEPGQKSQSRSKLYNSMVGRYANVLGYQAEISDHGNTTVYELFKIL